VILPLANKRDKITQIIWGIADFEHRFGHSPYGMWLPETAVDLETLTLLSDNNIKFTILAPWQVSLAEDQFHGTTLPGQAAWQQKSNSSVSLPKRSEHFSQLCF
jgi:predicted glycosyl hydrolase (DUF1957 family)